MGTIKINVIYDSRKFDRYEQIIHEFKRQNISDYEIFPCLLMQSVVTSINNSHKMIVRKAKREGLKEVCVAEDDIFFPSENGWKYFLDNKPESFDIYSAGNYMAFKRPEKYGVMKVDCIVGFHLYIVHHNYYDKFLATPDDKHIDSEQKGELYVCYPMPALQRPGFSSNNKAMTNYNSILSKEDIYQ